MRKRVLLSDHNVWNIAAKLWWTRYASAPRKNLTNVTKIDIFVRSIIDNFFEKKWNPESSDTAIWGVKINVDCLIQVGINKMLKIQKINLDYCTKWQLIMNCKLIYNWYDDHSKCQTGSGKILSSCRKISSILAFETNFKDWTKSSIPRTLVSMIWAVFT